jgi:hypothetical protein
MEITLQLALWTENSDRDGTFLISGCINAHRKIFFYGMKNDSEIAFLLEYISPRFPTLDGICLPIHMVGLLHG